MDERWREMNGLIGSEMDGLIGWIELIGERDGWMQT